MKSSIPPHPETSKYHTWRTIALEALALVALITIPAALLIVTR